MIYGGAGDARRWYAVHTKPKQEDRAVSNLNAWGIETLAPKLKEMRPHSSRGQPYCLTPLFPRYLFARFDAAALFTKVRLTRGVEGVVGFGECATPIDDATIALIRNRIQPDGFIHVAPPCPGDVVEIVDGPLRSLAGIFDRELSGGDRVLILLTSIGCSARVQVAKASIRKAPARLQTAACR